MPISTCVVIVTVCVRSAVLACIKSKPLCVQDFRLVIMCLELGDRIQQPPALGGHDILLRQMGGNPIYYTE